MPETPAGGSTPPSSADTFDEVNLIEAGGNDGSPVVEGEARRAYERVLAGVETGSIDAIITWHSDRLHRSPKELETRTGPARL